MCTPKGSAILYVKSNELRDKISPLIVSWGPLIKTYNDGIFIDEQEYQGTKDYSAFLSVPFTIEWMKNNDWEFATERCRALKLYAADLLCKIEGIKPL